MPRGARGAASASADIQAVVFRAHVRVHQRPVRLSELRRARYKDFSLDALTTNGDLKPTATSIANDPPIGRPETVMEKQDVLDKITEAFVRTLASIYHHRIDYPRVDGRGSTVIEINSTHK